MRELPSSGLALVKHEHARVEPTLAKQRQERQEMSLRAGDPRDLLDVQDASHGIAATTASAQ
jgi:hypothetical protein